MSAYVPGDERIVTIEDAAELQLQQDHVITLESRPANIEGTGEIRIRELVRNSLRMRPDRIIVGEVRGAETVDMLQAMNTGHEGSLTTIHANSPRDALARLETLVLTAGVELPLRAIREQISSAFDLLVQIQRLVDGSRRVTHITEVLRMESDVVTLQDIFMARPPDEETAQATHAMRLLGSLNCSGPQAALPREDGGQRRHAAADVLRGRGRLGPAPQLHRRELRRRRPGMIRRSWVAALVASVCALGAPVVAGAGVEIRSVDAGAYPRAQATVVTSKPSKEAPQLTEGGKPAAGVLAKNLGESRSICLAVDHSRSMRGVPLTEAAAAARAFVAAKLPTDRICVTSFATKPLLLAPFTDSEAEASAALAGIKVDPVKGTALYDDVRLASQTLAEEEGRARIIILVTDGNETLSSATLADAIKARAGSRDHRLRRRHREQGVHAGPAEVPGEANRRPLLRGAFARARCRGSTPSSPPS